MSEKSTIFQSTQIGIETTPGTEVDADVKLLAVSIIPQDRTEAEAFRALGNKYPSLVALNKEWGEFGIEGKLAYNEVLYLLSSLINHPTPTLLGTTAYSWTFTPDTDGEDDGDTWTIEQGDANSAWQYLGARVSGLTFNFSRSGVNVSGSGISQEITTGITLTAAPTSMTPKPVLPTHLTFKMASTQAGLAGATALTRGFSMEFALGDKVGLAWPVGQDPVAIETVPTFKAKLKLATDSTGLGLLTQMRAGTTYWFQIKATGSLIETTYYYDFQLQFPAQIENPGDMADESGLYAMEYNLIPVHDATWGKAFQIIVQSDTSTL